MKIEDLDKVAALCDVAERHAVTAQARAAQGRVLDAEQSASEAADAISNARLALEALGARTPAGVPMRAVPLHQLDTPEVRRLLAGLEELLPLAVQIDQARGQTIEGPGGTMGIDVAEALGQLVARLALDVRGPSAAVTGGRE